MKTATSARLFLCCVLGGLLGAPTPDVQAKPLILEANSFRPYIDRFNGMEDENRVNFVPNAASFEWLKTRIPLFESSDKSVEEMYYYRWWALRKHLKQMPSGFVFTEFLTKPNPISSALGHHLIEGRWLRDPKLYDDYVLYWLRGENGGPQSKLHKYSGWLQYALYQRYLVTGDQQFLVSLLDDLVHDYEVWEKERQLPNGMFWQYDVWDAMEESISGSRKEKNVRPTINSYMYGNAKALAEIARLAGKTEVAKRFDRKAKVLKRQVEENLWNRKQQFFEVRKENGALADVREEIGFIPWYFNLPSVDAPARYETAWAQINDEQGFKAPYGLTTAERRHPAFRSHGVGTCEWDGAVWPYATSQTLTGLANVLRQSRKAPVTRSDYYREFATYVRSQRYDGLPYIGEYLDEKTGQWLMGKQERSRYYNHSTFSDLLITGVIGLCPRADDIIEVNPLLPAGQWAWFCLDDVSYHGRSLTIVWDDDGQHYNLGQGLRVFADGRLIAQAPRLQRITGKLKPLSKSAVQSTEFGPLAVAQSSPSPAPVSVLPNS